MTLEVGLRAAVNDKEEGRETSPFPPSPQPKKIKLTLFDMGKAKKKVFDHCAQTLRRRKLTLGDF